ncbi:cytoplasmic phosphatidylinositol transfer protein 1-like, partial [Psammomys obesus]|uniref:cytoplasmic phosphatidylinositol transfer protein 1-like n=1 Tax=Psammomys obesus TaxID=48139 RepID=UPI0024529BA2
MASLGPCGLHVCVTLCGCQAPGTFCGVPRCKQRFTIAALQGHRRGVVDTIPSCDPKHFRSEKTGRGQLREGWRDNHQPIMCSYKLVTVKFEVWGLQTRVEQFVHKVVRDILLIGHRQAFAWVDEWYDMTMDDVREYEKNMHEQTNIKVCNQHSSTVDDIEGHARTR